MFPGWYHKQRGSAATNAVPCGRVASSRAVDQLPTACVATPSMQSPTEHDRPPTAVPYRLGCRRRRHIQRRLAVWRITTRPCGLRGRTPTED